MRTLMVILGLGILILTSKTAGAEDIDKEFHKSFDVSRGASLHLDHGDGEVEITPWNKDVIDVSVRYKAQVSRVGLGGEISFDVDFRVTGETVHVIGREKNGSTIGILYRNVDEHIYVVRAPSYVTLDLDGEDGDVNVKDWNAAIECDLDDGSVRLSNVKGGVDIDLEDGDIDILGISGDLRIKGDDGEVRVNDGSLSRVRIQIEDGDVRLRNCRGDFEILVDDGDILMQQIEAGSAMIRTEDGDVDLHLVGAKEIEVATDDGTVELGLAKGLSLEFSIRTGDGHIDVSLPDVVSLNKTHHEVSGTWNGGRGRLHVSTEDGDVVLREY